MNRIKVTYYCNDIGIKCAFNFHGKCMTYQDCDRKSEKELTQHEKWYKLMEDKENG